MDEEYIHELVIKPSKIKAGSWNLYSNKNMLICNDCKSPLFYAVIKWGVVAEDNWYGILGNRGNRNYQLREVGLTLYCSKCGEFLEHYDKWFYPEDKFIQLEETFELDDDERAEIENCLHQWNQTAKFTSRYKSSIFIDLKNKLKEYELKHPLKLNKNKINRRKKKKTK